VPTLEKGIQHRESESFHHRIRRDYPQLLRIHKWLLSHVMGTLECFKDVIYLFIY
jgi:hypothetical protein